MAGKKTSLLFKAAAAVGFLFLGGLAALTLALKIYLPPEKVRGLIVASAQKALHREVRLKDISLSALRGLTLTGLEISEVPDFKAGQFAGMDAFQLKIQWRALLRKKIIVDQLAIEGFHAGVVKERSGLFNFSDLLAASPADAKSLETAKAAAAPLPFEFNLKSVSLSKSRLDYRDKAAGKQWQVSNLEASAKDISLAAGRLAVFLENFSADLEDNNLRLSGRVALDENQLEVPDMKGSLNGEKLVLALSVKDLSKAAKKVQGSLNLKKLVYAGTAANDIALNWDLSGLTPDLKSLGGWAKLHIDGGSFSSGKKGAQRSTLVKALLLPITILQKIGSVGSALKILPDFSNFLFSEVAGDYVFNRGVMTLRDFHLNSLVANVQTKGTIDLPAQKLNLQVRMMIAKLAPLDIDVGGTFENPAPRFKLIKTLSEPAKRVAAPALKLLDGLFKKKK